MDIEQFRDYCLSLPQATEDMPFGDDLLIYRIANKIFAGISLQRPDTIVVKCQPDRALCLRDHYPEITPAWHWNKRHWNDISLAGHLTDKQIRQEVRHAYLQTIIQNVTPASLRKSLLQTAATLGITDDSEQFE